MTVVTAERLGASVGAEVVGVDRDQLVHDEALPAWTLAALEAHGTLVFANCMSTTALRSRSPSCSAGWRSSVPGTIPRSSA